MKRLPAGIQVTLAVVLLLSGAASGGALPAAAAATPGVAATASSGDLGGFQLVAPGGTGWALLGQQLFWTDDGGGRWGDITPPGLGAAAVRAASFSDPRHGWVVATVPAVTGGLDYTLARTADGGQTWQAAPLALFAANDAAGMAGEVYLQFINPATGWLEVKQATSSNFNIGALFKTVDGGQTWTRLSSPTGEPAHFTSTLQGEQDASAAGRGRWVTRDGGRTWAEESTVGGQATRAGGPGSRSMATAQDGWGRLSDGHCEGANCALITQLVSTKDGGQTWSPVSLPGGQMGLRRTFAAPSAPTTPRDAGGLRVTYTGQGFDFCDPHNGLPTPAAMQTWYDSSPYKVWGLYLGGSSNHGLCGTLTKNFVRQLAQEGWLFIPTWVGPQAPCTSFLSKMDADPNSARSQGIAEADLAREAASNLGLTLSDRSGTIIYYDVEYFSNYPDTSCLAAVQAFISGWSGELRANGIQAGVYGAQCGQNLSAFASIPNVPDMVWNASWMRNPAYDADASLFGYTVCGFADSLWTNHQRLRQYAGGHDETWGGVTFNIDSDVIDGNVARVPFNCAPDFGQAGLFVDWYFDGQCVLKQSGGYPTRASIGLPPNSITSLLLGPHTEITVCQGEFYAPPCQAFSSDVVNLTGTTVGNDTIASMQISITIPLTKHLYIPMTQLSGLTP